MTAPLIIGAGLAAGAQIAGGIARNKQEREEAQRNRDFQERMSNTAYQRATDDMRMAGINPMLAFSQGGASSPSGSQASFEDVISPAVSSAQHGVRLREDIKQMAKSREVMQGDIELKEAEEQAAREDAKMKSALAGEADKRSRLHIADERLRNLEILRNTAELPGWQASGRAASGKFGETMAYIERLRQAIFGSSPIFFGPRVGGAPTINRNTFPQTTIIKRR